LNEKTSGASARSRQARLRRAASARPVGVVALCTFLIGVSSPARAWQGCEAPSAADAPQQFQLSNGLKVVLAPDPALPLVSVEMRYLVGSADEAPGKTGLAHFFEHLMLQGTKHYDDELVVPFQRVGGRANAATEYHATRYFETLPSQYLGLALWIESDRMTGLLDVLTQQRLDNQREVVLNERRSNFEDRPYARNDEYLAQALYPELHPYHHVVIGEEADIRRFGENDVSEFYRKHYQPSAALLVITGDFQPVQVRSDVERHFAAIPDAARPGSLPVAGGITEELPVPCRGPLVKLVREDKVPLPKVTLAWHAPRWLGADDAALSVWSRLLGGGRNNRLHQRLVVEQGVASEISVRSSGRRLVGELVVSAVAASGVGAEQLASALAAALEKESARAPSTVEVQSAKRMHMKWIRERQENLASRATQLGDYAVYAGSPDFIEKDLQRFSELSPALVHAAALRWMTATPCARVDLVPAQEK